MNDDAKAGTESIHSSPQPVHRLLQLTDFHFLAEPGQTMMGVDTARSFDAVLAEALGSGPIPDLALLTGDLVQDTQIDAYLRLKASAAALPCRACCLPGNHDDPELMAGVLAGDPLFCQRQILLDGWQVLCLDSTVRRRPEGRLAEGELDFLAAALDRYPERHALVALHHHPRPCGSRWMDTMVLENAARFFAVLASRPWARTVVFGHIHQALDLEYQGIRLLGTPSTCFQFKPGQAEFAVDPVPPGWRWIELYGDGRIATRIGRLPELPAGLDFSARGYAI